MIRSSSEWKTRSNQEIAALEPRQQGQASRGAETRLERAVSPTTLPFLADRVQFSAGERFTASSWVARNGRKSDTNAIISFAKRGELLPLLHVYILASFS
jgi:uncharacterized protein YidB (DUF937 family)